MLVGTIATRRFGPAARVLGRSVERHLGVRLAVLALDAGFDAGEPLDVIKPSELALPPGELTRMRSAYNEFQLATALKGPSKNGF